MTNKQAAYLRSGMTIRRKALYGDHPTATDRETFVVERVEPPMHYDDSVTVYAGGHSFKAWEIERVLHDDR